MFMGQYRVEGTYLSVGIWEELFLALQFFCWRKVSLFVLEQSGLFDPHEKGIKGGNLKGLRSYTFISKRRNYDQ
ncbi:hypothetical protein GOP47_0020049 [Adiantum capillus-veneris]|uniref:Uncharacterized protein n=1 Tax=Adiantum capillus-veneris TaxID=13818 RepID=A0A9D4UDL9_ADICA|nr:hypothetical protein GOP47_0020049 [Adiantum capillus-veneris]